MSTKCQWCNWLSVTAHHVTGGIRGVSLGPFPQLVLVLEQLAAGALGPAGQHAHDDLQGGQVRGRNVWRTCVEQVVCGDVEMCGETGVDANWRGLEAQVWMQVSEVEGVRSQR